MPSTCATCPPYDVEPTPEDAYQLVTAEDLETTCQYASPVVATMMLIQYATAARSPPRNSSNGRSVRRRGNGRPTPCGIDPHRRPVEVRLRGLGGHSQNVNRGYAHKQTLRAIRVANLAKARAASHQHDTEAAQFAMAWARQFLAAVATAGPEGVFLGVGSGCFTSPEIGLIIG